MERCIELASEEIIYKLYRIICIDTDESYEHPDIYRYLAYALTLQDLICFQCQDDMNDYYTQYEIARILDLPFHVSPFGKDISYDHDIEDMTRHAVYSREHGYWEIDYKGIYS